MPTDNNEMRAQIRATPAALTNAFATIESTVRLILATPEIYATRRIILVGSGDSFFAAKAAETSYWAHAFTPCEARVPMEAGRYLADLSDNLRGVLVIALSNSGRAARAIEAAKLARRKGALVLALTADAASPLAEAANRVLTLERLALPGGPGFGPYLLWTIALQLLAIRFGEVKLRMTMDQAQGFRRDLHHALDLLDTAVQVADEPCSGFAATVASKQLVEFVGSGPSFAVADFAAAKMLEASGMHALARDAEEWVHLNYFDAWPQEIATVVFAPAQARAQSRIVETLIYMARLGRAALVVGGDAALETARALDMPAIALDCGTREELSPVVLSAVPALIAAHHSALVGARYGRGATGPWADCADARTVQRSALWGCDA